MIHCYTMKYEPRQGYMSIKEAAVRYRVSRAKLHRMIRHDRLETAKDPRDERATLLRTEDLEALFRFPAEEEEAVTYDRSRAYESAVAGRLTADLRARVDAMRVRIAGGKPLAGDSAAVIREEREKRSRHIEEALGGAGGEGGRRQP